MKQVEKIEVVHDTGYGFIARKVMRNKSLSIESKAIYSYLASFAGNTGKAFPSVELMLSELKISKDRFYKYMNELKKYGFVKVVQEKQENKFKKNIYYLLDSPCPCFEDTENKDTQFEDTGNKDTNSNNLNSNNLNSNNNKEYSSAKAKQQIPFKEIIEYLNNKTEKNYSYKAKGNRTLIRARWNENYTLEDFKRVIDIKTEQWKDDPKMKQYLRPSTLFNSKFDNYLNEEMKEDASKSNNAGNGYWEVL